MIKKIFAFIFFFFSGISANAQSIEFVIGSSSGGPDDQLARQISAIIENNTNINLVVLNKPGAAHHIAYQYILQSKKPSLIVSTSAIEIHAVYQQLETVKQIGKFSMYVFAHQESEINSLEDIKNISARKEILFGHGGVNTFSYSGMKVICQLPVRCLPVGYRSGADGMLGILSKQIDLYALVSYGASNFVDNPRVKKVHKMSIENNYVTLFSKNINKLIVDRITAALNLHLNSSFFEKMKLERY